MTPCSNADHVVKTQYVTRQLSHSVLWNYWGSLIIVLKVLHHPTIKLLKACAKMQFS